MQIDNTYYGRTFTSRLFASISNLQLRYSRLVLIVLSEKLPLAAKHYRQRPMFVSTCFSVCPVTRPPLYHAGSKGESESAEAKRREDALPWSRPYHGKNREDRVLAPPSLGFQAERFLGFHQRNRRGEAGYRWMSVGCGRVRAPSFVTQHPRG